MTVAARWAVWSKNAGDRGDYHIVAGGKGYEHWFDALLRSFQPGTPDTLERGHAASLPWVTVAPDSAGAELMLAVVDWSAERDGSARPITSTSMYLLPTSAVVEHGHLALYTAAVRQKLPPDPSTDRIELTIDASPPGLSPPGASWCAAVAALLLEGRVVITRPGSADASDRMAVVDGVSRMLPATYRAGLSFASWATTPEQRPHRLCFGPYAEGDLAEVRWDAVPAPRTATAQRYLALARKYLAREGEERLLAHLAAHKTQCSFDSDPQTAVAILAEMHVPDAVISEIHRGQGDIARAKAALANYGEAGFGADVSVVYRFLLDAEHIDADVLVVLAHCWSPTLIESIAAMARTSSGGHHGRLVSTFIDRAMRAGELDKYLAGLLAPDGQDIPPDLVQICVDTWFLHRATYPRLREVLLKNPGIGTSCVLECRDNHPSELVELLRWMGDGAPRRPPWLQVLLAAASDTETSPPSEVVERAIRQSPPTAQIAFDIAAARHRLWALDGVVWRQLAATAQTAPDNPARQLLVAAVGDAAALAESQRDRARLDLLLLMAGEKPVFMPTDLATTQKYVAALSSAVAVFQPVGTGELYDWAAVSVARAIWSTPSYPLVGTLIANTVDQAEGYPLPKLSEYLSRQIVGLGGAVLLDLLQPFDRVWVRFFHATPGLAHAAMMTAVRGSTPEVVARCWAAMLLAARPQPNSISNVKPTNYYPRALDMLRTWPLLSRPDALATVVWRTQDIRARYDRTYDARIWRQKIESKIVHRPKVLGERAAEAMRDSLLARIDYDEERTRSEIAGLRAKIADARSWHVRDEKELIAELDRRLRDLQLRRYELGGDLSSGLVLGRLLSSLRYWWNRLLRMIGRSLT